jgi:hypothetical protein
MTCYEQKDHLEKAPHAFIAVHVVDVLPIARQVNVEPCTADDWELIQLHAGSIEVELLRQVIGTRQQEWPYIECVLTTRLCGVVTVTSRCAS